MRAGRDEELVALATEARERAYAPYSHFAVGAALLARSGKVYTGCNVENASYGLSMCAERVTVFKAVEAGEREFEAIAVVSETGATPCGACRQVLAEFSHGLEKEGGLQVIVADLQGWRWTCSLAELLPQAFTQEHLTATQ
jgi:cytidine deaminase